jgi:hypothetical protein
MSREHTPSSTTALATIRLTGGASTPVPPITCPVDGSSSLSLTPMSEAPSNLRTPPTWRSRVLAPSSLPLESDEHRLLTGVYYIFTLRNSIISLGQLDENGLRMEIKDRVMRIWDCHCRLLAKVPSGTNQFYVLNMQIAQPLCLAARRDDEAWQ